MANYSIIINSKFKPFSYAEMLAPVQQSTEAHQKLEEAYADLTTQADMVAAKANEQTDPKAYARYKKYSEQLQQQAERLARYGLQPDSRGDVFAMKSRFTKDILPIAEAVEKRQKYADMQTQAQLQNPTLLIGKKAATTSLDEFLDNPNIDFSQQYSGATLMQQVATQAQALAKELTSYGPGKALDSYTNTFLKKFGFNRDQVLNAINNPNDPNSSKVLKAIVDQALISSGIPQWGDPQILERARAYANQGLWSAIGASDVGTFDNYGARQNLQFSQSVALENLKHQHNLAEKAYTARLAGGSGGGGGGGLFGNGLDANLPIRPNPIIVNNPEIKKQAEVAGKYDRFFTKDKNGRITGLTAEGRREFNKTIITTEGTGKDSSGRSIYTPGAGREVKKDIKLHSDFYNYVVGLNGGRDFVLDGVEMRKVGIGAVPHVKSRNLTNSDIVNIYDKEMQRLGITANSGKQYYDALAIKATQTNFPVTKEYQDNLKSGIISARLGNDKKLEEVVWDSKTNTYKTNGNYLGKSTLENEKTIIHGMEKSSRGLVYKVTTKNGNEKTYLVPEELNVTSYGNSMGGQNRSELLQRLAYEDPTLDLSQYARYLSQDEYNYLLALQNQVNGGTPLTATQIQDLNNAYRNDFILGNREADNLFWITKTEDYKPTPH